MIHIGLTLLFGAITLAGTLLPWDAAASARLAGLTREWSVVLLPLLLIGGVCLLAKRRGTTGWLLAALLWVACFPIWQVVHAPNRLVAAMAARLGQADSAYVWTRYGMDVGKLTEQAVVPDQGDCPRAFLSTATEWLAPGYWLTLVGLSALVLVALASPRHGSRRWSLAGYTATAAVVAVIGWLVISSWLLTRRWDRALDELAAPDTSRSQLAKAIRFVDEYPPTLLNPVYRALVLRADAPLDTSLRADLEWRVKEWSLAEAPALLARIPEPDADTPSRVALRRLWWGPTLREWMKKADKLGAHRDVEQLINRLGDAKTAMLWSFVVNANTGRWEQAQQQAEALIKDPVYARYQTSLQDALGTLLSRSGQQNQARELWQSSFTSDPTNNDPAIHGLGAVGP